MKRGLLDQLRRLASDRCDYCRLPAIYDPLPFQVDHIIAEQHGGATVIENLAWSCLHCNKHKGPNIAGIDPLTGEIVPLFHPRRQRWDRHFSWDGVVLIGRTRSARATIRVLAINDADFVAFRTELFAEGVYPPLGAS
ncbi:MAG: HNH endonuclease [Planctomycetes bacterium]|nr:HNH endonuclease [Planctomycetota bacterium]